MIYPPIGLYTRTPRGLLSVRFGGYLPDADSTVVLAKGSFFKSRKVSANRVYTLPDPGDGAPHSVVIECETPDGYGFTTKMRNGGGTPADLEVMNYGFGYCFVWNDPDWEYTGIYKVK